MATRFHVQTHNQVRDLDRMLRDYQDLSGQPVGLDTETTECDPRKESPVGRARLWCLTLAWGQPGDYHTAFVPKEFVYYLKGWLEAVWYPKVGSGIWRYDRHVCENEGIRLSGILGDTERMSRLLNPTKMIDHGLKALGHALGWNSKDYADIASRRKHGPERVYKRDRVVTDGDWPVVYTSGAVLQNLRKGTEVVSMQTVWDDYPQRRADIVKYACQDAAMSLDVFFDLREKLKGVNW